MLVWWLMVAPWVAIVIAAHGRSAAPAAAAGWRLPSLRKTVLVALLITVAVLWSIPVQDALSGQPTPLRLSVSAATPWQVAAQLTAATPREPAAPLPELRALLAANYPGGRFTGTVFASETLGDFFYWDLGADTPVFIYTHVHLFTPRHWQECRTVRYGLAGWRQVLDRYGANLVVVEADRHARPRPAAAGRGLGGRARRD